MTPKKFDTTFFSVQFQKYFLEKFYTRPFSRASFVEAVKVDFGTRSSLKPRSGLARFLPAVAEDEAWQA